MGEDMKEKRRFESLSDEEKSEMVSKLHQRRHGEADAAKSTAINMLATAPVVVQASKEALE